MQMKSINLASVSRKKDKNNANNETVPSKSLQVLNKIEDFSNIFVMRGTAKRKHIINKENNCSGKTVQKNSFKENFLKLRAPSYKSHYKQFQTEEKLMTKSCEILLECIKPYKDIRVAKKTVTESVQTIGSILKTNAVICERKATRKIQFLTFSEETPISYELKPFLDFDPCNSIDFNTECLEIQNEMGSATLTEAASDPNLGRTVSSEDFITKVFSKSTLF